jgi:UTP--glucose-1-phosphate uridylyltransferase
MKINKAIIANAGFGTRFLPITKTIQKEMLPVIDRPVVDYVVDDLIGAGITEIIFVISEHNKQLLHYYRENSRLEEYLKKMGKEQLYEKIKNLHQKAQFHFVKQTDEDQYGTSVPVKLAQNHLNDEDAFAVLMGDDILYNADGSSEMARMIAFLEQTGASNLATFVEQPQERLHMYGVADIIEKNGTQYLKALVEKPEPGTAPSNLANISKYILTPEIFEAIDKQLPNPKSGELYITDAVTTLAQKQDVLLYTPQGT